VLTSPAELPPLPALLAAFLAAAPLFERDRAVKELRHRIVASTPELQERELMKMTHLTEAITEALEQRGAPPGAASLAAACGPRARDGIRGKPFCADDSGGTVRFVPP
jgi:hypothetical protein